MFLVCVSVAILLPFVVILCLFVLVSVLIMLVFVVSLSLCSHFFISLLSFGGCCHFASLYCKFVSLCNGFVSICAFSFLHSCGHYGFYFILILFIVSFYPVAAICVSLW